MGKRNKSLRRAMNAAAAEVSVAPTVNGRKEKLRLDPDKIDPGQVKFLKGAGGTESHTESKEETFGNSPYDVASMSLKQLSALANHCEIRVPLELLGNGHCKVGPGDVDMVVTLRNAFWYAGLTERSWVLTEGGFYHDVGHLKFVAAIVRVTPTRGTDQNDPETWIRALEKIGHPSVVKFRKQQEATQKPNGSAKLLLPDQAEELKVELEKELPPYALPGAEQPRVR